MKKYEPRRCFVLARWYKAMVGGKSEPKIEPPDNYSEPGLTVNS